MQRLNSESEFPPTGTWPLMTSYDLKWALQRPLVKKNVWIFNHGILLKFSERSENIGKRGVKNLKGVLPLLPSMVQVNLNSKKKICWKSRFKKPLVAVRSVASWNSGAAGCRPELCENWPSLGCMCQGSLVTLPALSDGKHRLSSRGVTFRYVAVTLLESGCHLMESWMIKY